MTGTSRSEPEPPTWAELDEALWQLFPSVPDGYERRQYLPSGVRATLDRLPAGSPFALAAALTLIAAVGGVWFSVLLVVRAPIVAAGLYLAGLGISYLYLLFSAGDSPAGNPDEAIEPMGGTMLKDRSWGGKAKMFLALVPGTALAFPALASPLFLVVLLVGPPSARPLIAVPLWLGTAVGIYLVGGYCRGSEWGERVVAGSFHFLLRLGESQFARDAISVPKGILMTTLSLVMLAIPLAFVLGIIGGLIQSPELIPIVAALALAYFGFVVFEIFLAAIGSIVGFVAGGFAGFVVIPPMLTQNPDLVGSLVIALITASICSTLGRWLLPLVHRLSIQLGGFVVGGVSVYVLLPWLAPGLGEWLTAGVAVVAGVVLGVVVWIAYVAYVVLATSLLGALVIGAFTASLPVGAGVFLTGALFQGVSVFLLSPDEAAD